MPSRRAMAPRPDQGWHAFLDMAFLWNAVLTLRSAALAVVIGYHPRRVRAADTLTEGLPDVRRDRRHHRHHGAQYGLVVGFVVFGIGGLIRFRTDLRCASLRVTFIFQSPHAVTRQRLEILFEELDPLPKGTVDWEID